MPVSAWRKQTCIVIHNIQTVKGAKVEWYEPSQGHTLNNKFKAILKEILHSIRIVINHIQTVKGAKVEWDSGVNVFLCALGGF